MSCVTLGEQLTLPEISFTFKVVTMSHSRRVTKILVTYIVFSMSQYHAKYFVCSSSLDPSNNPVSWYWDYPHSTHEEPEVQKDLVIAQGHKARQWPSWDVNVGGLIPGEAGKAFSTDLFIKQHPV